MCQQLSRLSRCDCCVMKPIHKAEALFIQIKFRFFTILVWSFSHWSDFSSIYRRTTENMLVEAEAVKLCHSNRYSNSVISNGNFSLHCQILKSSLNHSNWNSRPTQWPCERSSKKVVCRPVLNVYTLQSDILARAAIIFHRYLFKASMIKSRYEIPIIK